MASRWVWLLSLGVVLVQLWNGVEGIEFTMQFMTKCISETIPTNMQVEVVYTTYDKQDSSRAVGTRVSVKRFEDRNFDSRGL